MLHLRAQLDREAVAMQAIDREKTSGGGTTFALMMVRVIRRCLHAVLSDSPAPARGALG